MIFHVADLHLDSHLYGVKRLRESAAVLGFILAKAQELRPRAVLFAGDVYETPAAGLSAQALWMDFLADMAEICPVLVLAGNHDGASLLGVEKKILSKRRIFISSASRLLGGSLNPTAPDVFDMEGLGVCALPFVSKAGLANVAESEGKAYARLLENDGGAGVVCAHLTVSGATLPKKTLEPDAQAGIFEKFEYAALGHIHKRQSVGHCHYAGSPLCLSFDEAEWEHGFSLYDEDSGGVSFVPVPQPVAMKQFSSASADELIDSVTELARSGDPAWIKCVYSGRPRPALRQELDEACKGSSARVLALQRAALAQEAAPTLDGESLHELDPAEVFDMIMQARKEPPEMRGRLRRDFAGLLREVRESAA